MGWGVYFGKHHDRARDCDRELGRHRDLDDAAGLATRGILAALLAIGAAMRGQLSEQRKIRRLLEKQLSNDTASLNLTGRVVPKHGGCPMPAGPFNPTETEDVQFAIDPRNATGGPTVGPFAWSVSDGAAGTLQVSPDTKSCRLVTNPGSFDVVIVVQDPRSGASDTAPVSRSVVPPDNNTVSINLSGSTIPK